jgi:ParB-like chromosome segregation protein Spo0J
MLRDRSNSRSHFDRIKELARSMREVGQLSELLVVPDTQEPGCWDLRSGGRRLRAARDELHWEYLRCMELRLDDLRQELASLDANLENEPFQGVDFDHAIARQKVIYEMLNPETVQGSNQHSRPDGEMPKRFTQIKAEQLGVSETTIKDAIRRAEGLSDSAKAAYQDGTLDKTEATLASTLPKPVQDELLARAFAAAAESPKEARRILRQGLREEATQKRQVRQEKRLAKLIAATGDIKPPQNIDLRLLTVKKVVEACKGVGFTLVHADPDWKYDNSGLNGAAGNHYVQDHVNEIVVMLDKAYDCAADDSYLLLWVTWPLLQEWFDATHGGEEMRWQYKSGGSWHKTGRLGIGFHWRGDSEALLLYVKGNPRPFKDDTSNAFGSERTQHSEKPEAWLRRLVATFSDKGDKVLDLWAGMAPVARACLLEGRSYVGAEIDEARHKEALLLLSKVQ